MWERVSAFGVSHSVDFSKAAGDSILHVPLNIARQAVPKVRESPRLLKLAGKIDERTARKASKRGY